MGAGLRGGGVDWKVLRGRGKTSARRPAGWGQGAGRGIYSGAEGAWLDLRGRGLALGADRQRILWQGRP